MDLAGGITLGIAIVSLGLALRAERRSADLEERTAVQWSAEPIWEYGRLTGYRVRNIGHAEVKSAEADAEKLSRVRIQWSGSFMAPVPPGGSFRVTFVENDAESLDGELPIIYRLPTRRAGYSRVIKAVVPLPPRDADRPDAT